MAGLVRIRLTDSNRDAVPSGDREQFRDDLCASGGVAAARPAAPSETDGETVVNVRTYVGVNDDRSRR